MRFSLRLLALPLLASFARAGELSLYALQNLSVQYEGTGHRGTAAGWELKVKPQGAGQGLRWRAGRFQLQYWRNNPYFSWEDGNSDGPVRRQSGQTRMAVQTVLADGRWRLAGAAVEAVSGIQAMTAAMDRKNVSFNAVEEAGTAKERMEAAGVVFGFHGAKEKALGPWSLWVDGEALTGHFFWSRNRLRASGGSIHRSGFSYLFRVEAGVRRGDFRLGAGVVRQMMEVLVPGGRSLSNGAAASLPINKFDFESPFVSVTWAY